MCKAFLYSPYLPIFRIYSLLEYNITILEYTITIYSLCKIDTIVLILHSNQFRFIILKYTFGSSYGEAMADPAKIAGR